MKLETVTLTGATGYLGSNLIPFLLDNYEIGELRALGRNEWKLEQLQDQYNITPIICDIRDESRVISCLKDSDIVIHAAALKRLTLGNINPQEYIKTNIIGSMNVLHAVLNHNVKKCIYISSDKACFPKNLYGITKACAEEMFIQRAKQIGYGEPNIHVVRYGNIIGSTGAFIPRVIKNVKRGEDINLTDERMTRFIVPIKSALDTIKRAIDYQVDGTSKYGGTSPNGELFIPKTFKKIKILDAINWLIEYFNSSSKIKITCRFSGEKLHEELVEGITSEKTDIDKEKFLSIIKSEGLID